MSRPRPASYSPRIEAFRALVEVLDLSPLDVAMGFIEHMASVPDDEDPEGQLVGSVLGYATEWKSTRLARSAAATFVDTVQGDES